MKRGIVLPIILSLIITLVITFTIPVEALPTQLNYHTAKNTMSSYVDILETNPIPLGSQINDVTFSVNLVGKPTNELCQLMLIDDVLNFEAISEKFTCNGTTTVSLTQKGVDALENNLSIESFRIGVNYPNTSLTTFSVNFADINYHAPQTFAKVENGIVTNVIVAEQSFMDNQLGTWVQTDINRNYAGIGYSWDGIYFKSPQPYPSWTFNVVTYSWASPVPHPNDGFFYTWNEETLSWVKQ